MMKKRLILWGSLIAAPALQASDVNSEIAKFKENIAQLKITPAKYNALPAEQTKLKNLISTFLMSYPELRESDDQFQAACKFLNTQEAYCLLNYPKQNLKLFLEYQPYNCELLIQEWREFITNFKTSANELFTKLSVDPSSPAVGQLAAMNNTFEKLDQDIQALNQEIKDLITQLEKLRSKFKKKQIVTAIAIQTKPATAPDLPKEPQPGRSSKIWEWIKKSASTTRITKSITKLYSKLMNK